MDKIQFHSADAGSRKEIRRIKNDRWKGGRAIYHIDMRLNEIH